MALVEWEFSGESGGFLATGKVIEQLRRHLAKSQVDEAVRLYEGCAQESVGPKLWEEFEGSSNQMQKAIANLFFRSRDYQRAAQACEKLEEWDAAARAYERSDDFLRAGACLLKNEKVERAAEMFDKAGQFGRAAQLFFRAGNVAQAAASMERTGDLVGAGQLWFRARQFQQASQALSRVPAQHPGAVTAAGLLSEAHVQLNRRDLARTRLQVAVAEHGVSDALTAELAYRLGRLCWEAGLAPDAKAAFTRVRTFDPAFKDVSACLDALARGTNKVPEAADPFAVREVGAASKAAGAPAVPPAVKVAPKAVPTAPSVVSAPTLQAIPAMVTDPGAFHISASKLLSEETLQLKEPPPPADTVPLGLVQKMPGYEALKGLALFEELSLVETKAFYELAEHLQYTDGQVIIEQGHPGAGLFIAREGTMRVSKIEAGGKETVLATLGPGKHVGEMSLIDDAPTSARVTADGAVRVLHIPKDRFERFLFRDDRIALRLYRAFVRGLCERLRTQNAAR